MKHVNGFGPAGIVDNAKSTGVIDNSEFFDALPYGRHRFEIVGLVTALNFVELVAGVVTRTDWKSAEPVKRIAKESDWFLDAKRVLRNFVIRY